MKNITSKLGPTAHGEMSVDTTVRLLVHKDDYAKAQKAMSDYK
ncbi:hypothetical protein J2R98_000144 [Alkalibacillus filiformis]|uniref:DUF2007 domain-containing protein n=1 Tax=Alkalibacillus filiformis TaxID=200990 RepID=A0ABU0DPH4_9BACI|nr:hypothetical protein [Alkalibacillus filiformis]MDQ0350341.1 hypothetical protein [Alkalibacillus filiformis]